MEPFVFMQPRAEAREITLWTEDGKRGDDSSSSSSTPAHTTDKLPLTR
jgi:hypothetical protein